MDEVLDYANQLWKSPEPFQWLRDRGLTDETIWTHNLGYVGRPLEGDHPLLGSIEIPYFDARGRRVGARYRHLLEDRARRHKYQAEAGSGSHLYGVVAVDSPELYVVEGEFDKMILNQVGKAAVGVPGVNAFNTAWKWLFRNCDLVHLMFDGDSAVNEQVKKARNRVAGALRRVTDVVVHDLPDEMDVTDLYLAGRLEEVL